MKSTINTKVKREENSWQFIWSFYAILLGLITTIILYLPFGLTVNLITLFIILCCLTYICILNGWGVNKIIRLKIWIEDQSRTTELNIKAISALIAIIFIAILLFFIHEKNKHNFLIKQNNLQISNSISPVSSNIETIITQYYSIKNSDDRKKFIADYKDAKMHGSGNLLKKSKSTSDKGTEFIEIWIDVQGDIIKCYEIVTNELDTKLIPFHIGDKILFTGIFSGQSYIYQSSMYIPAWDLESCKF
ncbi:hypothetical protein H7X87_00195 [Acetobacteraceae bacterium]|nr:hypothetical protein [Candidatus Parcubacteria bacterium]